MLLADPGFVATSLSGHSISTLVRVRSQAEPTQSKTSWLKKIRKEMFKRALVLEDVESGPLRISNSLQDFLHCCLRTRVFRVDYSISLQVSTACLS